MKGTSDGWAKPKWISNIFKQEDYLITLFSNYCINPIVFAQISVCRICQFMKCYITNCHYAISIMSRGFRLALRTISTIVIDRFIFNSQLTFLQTPDSSRHEEQNGILRSFYMLFGDGDGGGVIRAKAANQQSTVRVKPLDMSKDTWGYFQLFLWRQNPGFLWEAWGYFVPFVRCKKLKSDHLHPRLLWPELVFQDKPPFFGGNRKFTDIKMQNKETSIIFSEIICGFAETYLPKKYSVDWVDWITYYQPSSAVMWSLGMNRLCSVSWRYGHLTSRVSCGDPLSPLGLHGSACSGIPQGSWTRLRSGKFERHADDHFWTVFAVKEVTSSCSDL